MATGTVHGWAMMVGGQEPTPTPELSYEDVIWALQQPGTKELVKSLAVIGGQGELGAATHGYAGDVAYLMDARKPEVAAAALEAVGKMGLLGREYGPLILEHLTQGAAEVRIAAANALASLGNQVAAPYAPQVLALALEDDNESVKVACLLAVGHIGKRGDEALVSKLSELLASCSSPQLAAATCQALGLLGDESKAESIGARLQDQQTRYAALCGLHGLGSVAVCKFASVIVDTCLTDKDIAIRHLAKNALGLTESTCKDNDDLVPKVMELLTNQDPGVRSTAALVLGQRGNDACSSLLLPLLDDEAEDTSWRCLQMGGAASRPPCMLRKPVCAALVALGMLGSEAERIAKKLDDDSWEVRISALEGLGLLPEEAGLEYGDHIVEMLEDDVYLVRVKACEVLAQLQAEDKAGFLPRVFDDKSPSVRLAAITALGKLGEAGGPYSNEAFKLLSDSSTKIRAATIHALGCMGETGQCYASVIAAQLNDAIADIRGVSVEALGKLGARGAAFAEEVAYCAQDPSPLVRAQALQSLKLMGSEADISSSALQSLQQLPFDELTEQASNQLQLTVA